MKKFINAFKNCTLQWEVKRRYYSNSQFLHIDRSLIKSYIFKNPYRISKHYLLRQGEKEVHTYGETPLFTYETIAKESGVCSADIFLELGCGRGRGMFFMHHFFQCKVIGIERIPLFVKLAKKVIQTHQIKKISVICSDITSMKLPEASVVYLYGSCLKDEEIQRFISKLQTLQKGTRIITISYPLTDYAQTFHLEKVFPVRFLWGETHAYLQTVK